MILVFVGAGGSAAVNADKFPTTVEFFERLPTYITEEALFVEIRSFLQAQKPGQPIDIEEILWNLDTLRQYFRASCDTAGIAGWIMADQRMEPLAGVGSLADLSLLLTGMRQLEEGPIRTLEDRINALVYDFFGKDPLDDELRDWVNLLQGLSRRDSSIEIFTTNYDVLLELAINRAGIDVETGRISNEIHMRLDTTFWDAPGEPIEDKVGRLTKLHGSVDWQFRNGDIVIGNSFFTGQHQNHLILYPGNKGEPESELFRKFHQHLLAVVENADVAIFIGYAFRDQYINSILSNLNSKTAVILINRDMDLPEGSFLSGCMHSMEGLTSESVEWCLLSLSPRFHISVGNEEYKRANFGAAIDAYGKALAFDGKHAVAYYNRGNAKCELGDGEGAVADFGKAIECDREFAEAYYNRGLIKSAAGDSEGGMSDYMKATGLGLKGKSREPAPIKEIETVTTMTA